MKRHAPAPQPRGRVAIVGRPNVGKSSLFNRLAGRRISIVHDQPGVTRDRLSFRAQTRRHAYDLMDTGGIGSAIDDSFDEQVRTEADIAIHGSDIVLLVVDGGQGLHPVDETIAKDLRKAGRRTILVVNKIDHPGQEANSAEFAKLGFESLVAVSAAHGHGTADLAERLDSALDALPEPPDPGAQNAPIHIAVVGRPNVGKSSLVNTILRSKRSIVSDISGTTRDAIDIPFQRGDSHYVLIDTAGIRPKGRHRTSVEVFSVMRSETSIRRADLCILVVDASDGVTSQDKKIAGLIQKSEKPCIVALNKWDLIEKQFPEKADKLHLLECIANDLFFIDYAPATFLSASTGEHVARIFKRVEDVRHAASLTIPTGQLNRCLHELLATSPPPVRNGKRFKILYATQLDPRTAVPPPEFMLFVNDPKLLPPNYLKFLERTIRKLSPYPGLPILFRLRGRERRYANSGK